MVACKAKQNTVTYPTAWPEPSLAAPQDAIPADLGMLADGKPAKGKTNFTWTTPKGTQMWQVGFTSNESFRQMGSEYERVLTQAGYKAKWEGNHPSVTFIRIKDGVKRRIVFAYYEYPPFPRLGLKTHYELLIQDYPQH